jgi:drug/metabolite transporter (DMT)-like permease
MIALLLAASCAVVWGTGDFCGGKASQRAPALAVSVLSKVVALPVVVAGVAVVGGHPSAAALGWGAAAGVFGMAGVILLYRGLATGAMSIVAPVTAVTSALVPFVLGILLDGAPRPGAVLGALCAIGAIALVSSGYDPPPPPTTPATVAVRSRLAGTVVPLALAAGLGFGLFMTLLSRAKGPPGTDVGLWPLAAAHLAALGLGAVLLRRTRTPVRVTGVALRLTLAAGVLDFTANILYLLATRTGALSVVAPVASLYPATTVLLALALDHERVRPRQLTGLALAAVALVLVGS